MLFIAVCYYHVTYAFESESTLYSCLNVKELLARNKHHIRSLSDSNRIQTHNLLVFKRNTQPCQTGQIIKLCCKYLYNAFDSILLSCHVWVSEWIYTLHLPEYQGTPYSKQVPYLKFKWSQHDSNLQPFSS